MVEIGSFCFPKDTTFWKSVTLEALSKERREITIESVISAVGNPLETERQLEALQKELESFDRGEAHFSVHFKRYFEGRRREFSVTPSRNGDAVKIHLVILTLDRFERSEEIHTQTIDLQPPTNTARILNRGNHSSPPCLLIQPSSPIEGFYIDVGSETLTYNGIINSGDILHIDCENLKAILNDTVIVTHYIDSFPLLPPGWSDVTINGVGDQYGTCEISHRDLWV